MGLERVPLPGRHSGLKEEATFLIESKQKVLYSFLHLSLKMEHSGGEKSASSVLQVTSPAPERVWAGRGFLNRPWGGQAVTLSSRDHHNKARKLSVKFNAS